MPAAGEEGMAREWFHRLANAREDPATLAEAREWLLMLLASVPLELIPSPPAPLPPGAEGRATDSPLPLGEGPGGRAELLAFHAPLALLEGAWMQGAAQTINGHQQAVAELSSAYLALLGVDESASPAFAYRGRLHLHGVALGRATSWQFAQDPRIGEPALRFASVQLALGHHAASFFPETLGFTLAYLHSDSPWRLPFLLRRREILETMARHAQNAWQTLLADGGGHPRLERGYWLYQAAETDYLAALRHYAITGATLADQVAGIFRRKLRFAKGYHAGVRLGGQSLEEWFAAARFDAEGFLAAFAASPYAAGEAEQRSFDFLTAFGGPMFGVFDREDLALIDTWLATARTGTERQSPAEPNLPERRHPVGTNPKSRRDLGVSRNLDKRALFHGLINHDPSLETVDAARCLVEKTLSKSSQALNKQGLPGRQFFNYSPQVFAERIAQIHDEEIAKHKAFQAPPKLRREEYLWGIRQFAPAILVDGCWLRHQGEAANQDSRVHRLLHRIYAEELGEGRVEWNHPKIYRDLLDGLGMVLPALETEAFARHPSFMDSAFDLPGYLLAISQFPKTYFPETLGLNLAIELSGLGVGYLRLADELRYWGINPLIVTLHLSIDNLAGGHAAMACEAIQSYLDEERALGGDRAMQATWRRIWIGYLSLDTVTRYFKWMLALEFCRQFVPARLLAAVMDFYLSWSRP